MQGTEMKGLLIADQCAQDRHNVKACSTSIDAPIQVFLLADQNNNSLFERWFTRSDTWLLRRC